MSGDRRPDGAPGGRPGPATLLRQGLWWLADYAYVLWWQVHAAVRRGGAVVAGRHGDDAGRDVVVLPGVYEPWQFLRPLVDLLRGAGHRVHVLPALGYNHGPVSRAAAMVGAHLVEHDLHDVVLVAHSKGGLIGKLAMLREDPEGRIASMVAVNTPFAGSSLARWVPVAAVRAFVPTDATLVALAAEVEVNARIVSAHSRFDPHIPGGSRLDGARNVELRTPGHFRALADPELARLVLEVVGRRS